MSFVIQSENPVVKAVIEGKAPRPAQLAAARGILPLPDHDLLEVLVAFGMSDDSELAKHANQTLQEHDAETLDTLVRSDKTSPQILTYLATVNGLPRKVQESIVTNSNTPTSTIVTIAGKTASADLLDVISLNQQLLIQAPGLIDAILKNPNRSSETDRRVSETKREFFEKERGQQQVADELRAQGKEAAAEFVENLDLESGDLTLDDAAFLAEHIVIPDSETDDSWLGLEYLEEIYEETVEQREAIVNKILGEMRSEDMDIPSERVSTINRIMKMGMKDRTRLAMKGDREARNILIRDPNRLVSQAVMANPRITEQEVEAIAAMRTVTEDILRQIAVNRQFSRCYSVMHNLVRNPRTPIANVLNILTRLQLKDLNALSKNRNVSDAVRRQALRLAHARIGK